MNIPRPALSLLVALAATAPATAQLPQRAGGSCGAPAEAAAEQTGLGPTPFFTHMAAGAGFLAAGESTRRTETHADQPGQLEPFGLLVPDLPAGATEVRHIVTWSYLLNGAPPALDLILVNGVAVVGDLVGAGTPDLCWGREGGAAYLFSAPGDDLVTLPIIHGVHNSFSFATDKPLGADPLAIGEGLTVLCVYEIAGDPLSDVEVWSGYASTESDPLNPATALADLDFGEDYTVGALRLLINCLDGQDELPGGVNAGDDLFINGVLASGALPGTVEVGDAWQGQLAPLGAFAFEPLNNVYDHADGDVSAFVVGESAGSLQVTSVRPELAADCVAHSLAAVTFELPAFAVWAPGKAGTGGLVPVLSGGGTLAPGSANLLSLGSAKPVAPVTLIVGLSPARVPFKGGVLGPAPDVLLGGFSTSTTGKLSLSFLWPQTLPVGFAVWVQAWIQDSGASFGLSASNTLKLTAQP